MFGTITSKEIAAELQAQKGIEIDKKKILLSEPIKAFGTYRADVKLYPEISAQIHIKVVEG